MKNDEYFRNSSLAKMWYIPWKRIGIPVSQASRGIVAKNCK